MIVLVTGGNGFLGRHIVRLLLERDSSVKEIRVFDLKKIENPDTNSKVPVVYTQGDITNSDQLNTICQGVGAIIHCASMIPIGIKYSNAWSINVKGAENIINACIEHNIPYLIYTSSTDVVVGNEDIIYGNETLTHIPKQFLFGDYAKTKYEVEKKILEANKQSLKNGELLKTVALRPTVMYGEGDIHFTSKCLKSAKYRHHHNSTFRVGSGHCKSQFTYVGNAAWAHLVALQALQQNNAVSGEAYFITDDTPLINFYNFLVPFFKIHNYSVSDFKIPFWPLYFFLSIVHFIFNLFGLMHTYEQYLPNKASVVYTCRTIFFNREKARLMLDYKPIYSNDESMKCTLDWSSNIDIENIPKKSKKEN